MAARFRPARTCAGRRRAARQRDVLAAIHSITSSARASSVGGISRPIAFAVYVLVDRLLDQRDTLRFSADCLPRFSTISYSITCPSLRELRPARSTAEIGTNTSLPPPPCG